MICYTLFTRSPGSSPKGNDVFRLLRRSYAPKRLLMLRQRGFLISRYVVFKDGRLKTYYSVCLLAQLVHPPPKFLPL